MSTPRETPSWLELERYALDELPATEREAIDAALTVDTEARLCLQRLRADRRELPPLPAVSAPPQSKSWFAPRTLWTFASAGGVLAAAILFVRGTFNEDHHAATWPGAKGDAIAVTLVRESAGAIAVDPSLFEPNDRFKVRVTCARAGLSYVDVVVYQGGEASFPSEASFPGEASFPLDAQQIACGNHVVLDGAFRLDQQSEAEVCVVLSGAAPADRRVLQRTPPMSDTAACTHLTPVP